MGLVLLNSVRFAAAQALTVAQEITAQAIAANSEVDHPLPLLASWTVSFASLPDEGWNPTWQLEQITENGSHIIPGMSTPTPESCAPAGAGCSQALLDYWQLTLEQSDALNLPVNFVGTQWERRLSEDAAYFNLPYGENPNVWDVGTDEPVFMLSPWGPLEPWYDVGFLWGSSWLMTQLQTWYPAPPLILFVSNNEHPKINWSNAEDDQYYVDLYGLGHTEDFKREATADGYVAHYRELQDGFRDGLTSATWKANAKFIGYDAFGFTSYGRWTEWYYSGLAHAGRFDPAPDMWDGGTPSYYYYAGVTDYTTYSTQVGAMNWVFMKEEALTINPSFWFEWSAWSGGASADPWHASFTPARYGAAVRFGMWVSRPRLVREYPWTGGEEDFTDDEPWYVVVRAAVDEIYTNATLRAFWRFGTLVPNDARAHPFDDSLLAAYSSVDRMFMLSTDIDPADPWTNTATTIPVFAMARVMGTTPNQEWLVYLHSPLMDRTDVVVTIPGYDDITIDAPIVGAFYLVKEIDDSVTVVT